MTKPMMIAAIPLALSLSVAQGEEIDRAAGKGLLDEHCYACHGSELYTRKDRLVTSRPGLSAQVQRCQLAQNLNWFEDEVENVAEYLDIEFYHLKK